MIKLIVNPESQHSTHSFDKSEITIGKGDPDQVDISLSEETIHIVHIKIIKEKGRYYALNIENDPFLELNGLPFGKKVLNDHDRILVGKSIICIEEQKEHRQSPPETAPTLNIPTIEEPEPSPKESLKPQENSHPHSEKTEKQELINKPETSKTKIPHSKKTDQKQEEKPLDEDPESLHHLTLEQLCTPKNNENKEEKKNDQPQEDLKPKEDEPLPQQENLEDAQDTSLINSSSEPEQTIEDAHKDDQNQEEQPPNSQENKQKEEIEEYVLSEFDDESENWAETKSNDDISQDSKPKKSWRIVAFSLLLILIIGGGATAGFLLDIKGAVGRDEKIIAGTVADIAMSLTYAHLNNITPRKLNWSDPTFLEHSLNRVLSPNLQKLTEIDNQGQFINYPYMIRIYTDDHNKDFVVIAQPSPNLYHWFVNTDSIVVDSSDLKLHKISDLKTLNRLLAAQNPLEGVNRSEISSLISQNKVIELTTLTSDSADWNFAPPKALALIHPGSENYIYNAPRYYPFSEAIMKRALYFKENKSNSYDLTLLQNEIDEISEYPDMILYSSQGMQSATDAQKSLSSIAPHLNFLVAYLRFNTQGSITSSHLLMDSDYPNETIAYFKKEEPENDLTYNEPADTQDENTTEDDDFSLLDLDIDDDIDPNHPLFLQLSELTTRRQKALQPLSDQIISLLRTHTIRATDNFEHEFEEITQKYFTKDKDQAKQISQKLTELNDEYAGLTSEEFEAYLDATALLTYLKLPNTTLAPTSTDAISRNKFDELIQTIEKTKNLKDLEIASQKAADKLENASNPKNFKHFQNMIHVTIAEKLVDILLAPELDDTNDLNPADRETLIKILKTSNIIDENEFEYFLSEFDLQTTENDE